MEDISSKISELLSSPDGMQKLQSMASAMLGNNSGTGDSAASGPKLPEGLDMQKLQAVASALGGSSDSNAGSSGLPGIDPKMLITLQKAFSGMNQRDKNVDLLVSLRPHLSDERSKRVDDAVRLMQLMKMLPLLKESGILGGDIK